jgi:antibiotic biosynthesis monooxygenase (ABM) superfamily enzyme
MIKVIVGYKAKDINEIEPILLTIRSQAMTYPGFVRSEILVSDNDASLIAVEKTWDKTEDWIAWEKSTLRQSLIRDASKFLSEEPRVTVYRIMPTSVRWVG